jgi:plastocyanin
MTRRHLVPAALLVTAALAATGCGGGKKSSTPPATTGGTPSGAALAGSVGPGFDISLKRSGQAVTTLTPGTYILNVDDQADIHNFHLTGPGVDVSTGVSFKGTKSFTITLKAGKYHYQCDPHSSTLKGDFTVG